MELQEKRIRIPETSGLPKGICASLKGVRGDFKDLGLVLQNKILFLKIYNCFFNFVTLFFVPLIINFPF